ncbi:MAG: phosphate ABC transporter permease PstA [Anaerolineae bacterium]|nr:phosphate ABC transporter permease PstA [Anaerolineae bacterium]
MKRKYTHPREYIALWLMRASMAVVLGSLFIILGTVVVKGLPALNIQMITQTPRGGYYLGKEGGILNAITGSLALAGGATCVSLIIGLPITLYLQVFNRNQRLAQIVRLSLDVLWGVPSIVYGAFGFTLLLWIGLRASLLGGILTLALVELPIMVRGMEEVVKMTPCELKEASYAVGATRLETALRVVLRQTAPGLITAILLAFGRGMGDAASVIFTAGYTDRMPTALLRPVASLPLAVFFQLGSPLPAVRERAYAAALILLILVLTTSCIARIVSRRLSRHIIH